MIGKLTGIIDQISGNSIILDVNGVGYVVAAGARTLAMIGGCHHLRFFLEGWQGIRDRD